MRNKIIEAVRRYAGRGVLEVEVYEDPDIPGTYLARAYTLDEPLDFRVETQSSESDIYNEEDELNPEIKAWFEKNSGVFEEGWKLSFDPTALETDECGSHLDERLLQETVHTYWPPTLERLFDDYE